MSSWIQQVMESTSELESPKSFFYWSALCTLSAVLKDNVYLLRGGAFKLYPNIYVMLLANSAMKKGFPIGLSKDIVKLVNNTKLIIGRSSIQGILKELGSVSSTQPGGKIVSSKSCGYFLASEFSSSLVEDPAAFNCLTDLYDRHWNEGAWKSLLKQETFTLKDPTLSMLVATNDPHLKDFVKEKDVYGGFFGRIFVIREEQVSHLNSLIDDLKNPPVPALLAEYPRILSQLNGPFKSLSGTAAGKFYDEWYHDFYSTIRVQKVEDKTGTIGRFGDSVLKVAMLLSLAEKPELEITKQAMEEAILVCEKFVEGVRKATLGHGGKAQFAEQKALIIHELLARENHQVTRQILLKKYWMHMNADDLDIIMRSFDDAGMVKPHNMGGTVVYQMPETIAKKLNERLRGDE